MLCFQVRKESERRKRSNQKTPNKTTKIEQVIVTDTFYINLQHAVTVLGDKTEPESSLRSYGLPQTRLKST